MEPIIQNRVKLTNEEIKRYSRHLILRKSASKVRSGSKLRGCY